MSVAAASEVYAVDVVGAEPRTRALRSVLTLAVNVLTWGGGPHNPGGRHVVVRDRTTGAVLATWRESFADDFNSLVDGISHDLATMRTDEFERKWVRDAPPST